MNSLSVKEKDSAYVAHTYGRFNLEITSGKGSLCYDENGKEYIDLGTGIAVNTFGFCDEQWVKAVTKQASAFQHTSNLYYHKPGADLAEMLCEKTGMKKVFFSNSGAEANECAIKVARKYGELNKGEGCTKILTLRNSFHGRTLTTLAATGQDTFHKDFLPLTEGFDYVEAGNIEELNEKASQKDVCAIMFEVVQGEGGVLPLSWEFVKEIEKVSKKYDLLMICDEVQIGNGRSGKLYGYMNFDITPDVVSTAKGLAGGLPLGATLLGEKVENIFNPGMHGSTFGANPVAAAGALSILSRLDDTLLEDVKKKSDYIVKELNGAEGIKSVSGMGLMLGIETEKPAKEVVNALLEKGVIVLTAKTKVRLLPALNIPFELLEKAVALIKECVK